MCLYALQRYYQVTGTKKLISQIPKHIITICAMGLYIIYTYLDIVLLDSITFSCFLFAFPHNLTLQTPALHLEK